MRDIVEVLAAVIAVVITVTALAACGERPTRADPERARAYSNDAPQSPLRERTLEQGESERMGS
jgi:hypothetical protein